MHHLLACLHARRVAIASNTTIMGKRLEPGMRLGRSAPHRMPPHDAPFRLLEQARPAGSPCCARGDPGRRGAECLDGALQGALRPLGPRQRQSGSRRAGATATSRPPREPSERGRGSAGSASPHATRRVRDTFLNPRLRRTDPHERLPRSGPHRSRQRGRGPTIASPGHRLGIAGLFGRGPPRPPHAYLSRSTRSPSGSGRSAGAGGVGCLSSPRAGPAWH